MLVFSITKDLSNNIQAGNFIKDISKKFNSGGGGPSHFGTAGFKDSKILKDAYYFSLDKIEKELT